MRRTADRRPAWRGGRPAERRGGRRAERRGGRRALWLVTAVLLLAACTGTFTPGAATIYLVFLDADATTPARVALVTFAATPTERRLDLLTEVAYAFPVDETVLAIDVLDRDDRSEAWVLTATGAASRSVRLHRLDLRAVPDLPGTTLAAAAPARTLTDAAGAWTGFGDPPGGATGCLSGLVAGPGGASLALFDAGSGARCGPTSDAPDPRVHVVDLADESVDATVDDALDPGVRPADPTDPAALLLVRRPPVGGLDVREVVEVSFAAPVPGLGDRGEDVDGLRDVAGVPGGFVALREATDGGRSLRLVVGDVTTERPAPAGATRVHGDPTGRLTNVLTTGGGRLGVTYPGEATIREVAFDATAVTMEPLNAYALAVRASGGLCLVDLLVPSASAGCDLAIAPALATALPAPRFVTWTYAEPSAP